MPASSPLDSLNLFRVAATRFANLSGVGSSLSGGRWNEVGHKAVYTSTEQGVPLLERLVHTPKDRIPANLAMMEIELKGQWRVDLAAVWRAEVIVLGIDEGSGARLLICSTLRHAKRLRPQFTALLRDVQPIALAVPSVIVPVWNVVLYP